MTRTSVAAIATNEAFDDRVGGKGGFGRLAIDVAQLLGASASSGARNPRPVPLVVNLPFGGLRGVIKLDTATAIVRRRRESHSRFQRRLRRVVDPDLVLTIGYRPQYDLTAAAWPRPLLTWIQDPRTDSDNRKIGSLSIPNSGAPPTGVRAIDCTGMASLTKRLESEGREVVFAAAAPSLLIKAVETYGLNEVPSVRFLPYPIASTTVNEFEKTVRPRVVFLGRLDPIKRPWVVSALATRFPEVEFLVMGQAHFSGSGAWRQKGPKNAIFVGHKEGEERDALLRSSWVLINTSIHEALPVSFIEALKREVVLLSCHDPEQLASRFGSYVGRFDGDGLDSVDAFALGLEALLADDMRRVELAQAGRLWANEHHSPERFLHEFSGIQAELHHAHH